MTKHVKTFIFTILIFTSLLHAGGFLKVSGKYIVNENNEEVILRGMGLGGWLLPEGYMLQTSGFADAFWQMKEKITALIGKDNADLFWMTYRNNFVQRKDIEQLEQMGFNSVRLVLHWEFFMDGSGNWKTEGFAIVDSVLQWCEDNNMYVILDLHAAPGGQSALAISDYNPSFLSLWESEINKRATIMLWRKLAERYKDEPWIGGYDVLNEPAWTLNPNNQPLRDLYIRITDTIRAVDTKHIIFIEGNWYATDFNGLTPPWDTNMVYSFHKYWNATDIGTINYLITLRNSINRPLWMGESGENSNDWFTKTISTLEANNIGWSWWTYKKIGGLNSMLNVVKTGGYNALLQYWNSGGTKPAADFAFYALLEQAEKLKLENCQQHPDVIDAMFRQPHSATLKPFAENIFPGKVFMVNYDFGGYGTAYMDADYTNTTGSAGGATWNTGGEYRNDGVDIEKCSDQITNGYNVGWTGSNESLMFTITVQQSGTYSIDLRVAANESGGSVITQFDGVGTAIKSIAVTGGWQSWQTQNIRMIDLTTGTHTMIVGFIGGGFNVNYIEATLSSAVVDESVQSLPKKFSLSQNFPNPFNPETTIKYQLPTSSNVLLKVFDLLGKEVATLISEDKSAGEYSVKFDASGIPSGVYFYTIHAGAFTQTRKMSIMK